MEKRFYIKNIHNYCDRWCDKCAFTARCRVYATENAIQPDLPDNPESPEFWDKLHDNFQKTLDMLNDMLEDMEEKAKVLQTLEELERISRAEGVEEPPLDDLDDDDDEDPPVQFPWAFEYADAVYEFFNKNAAFFGDQEEEFEQHVRMGLPIDVEQLGFLSEALHTIRRFEDLIGNKVHRAMFQKDFDDKGNELNIELQGDGNGSAKVAMISILRSTDAWQFVERYFPSKYQEISAIRQQLEALRARLALEYPDWEKFHRPGFDDAPEAVVRLDFNPN